MMIEIDEDLARRIEKRVRQVLQHNHSIQPPDNIDDMTREEFALVLKQIAIKYNCYIQSWVTPEDGRSECYNASTHDESDDNSYGLIQAPTEVDAIIGAFMWLSDRQNFNPVMPGYQGMNS